MLRSILSCFFFHCHTHFTYQLFLMPSSLLSWHLCNERAFGSTIFEHLLTLCKKISFSYTWQKMFRQGGTYAFWPGLSMLACIYCQIWIEEYSKRHPEFGSGFLEEQTLSDIILNTVSAIVTWFRFMNNSIGVIAVLHDWDLMVSMILAGFKRFGWSLSKYNSIETINFTIS